MTDLTGKQKAFIRCYGSPGSKTYQNAYQSALKAGYSKVTAYQAKSNILENPKVKAALAKKADDWAKKCEYNYDQACQQLDEIIENVEARAQAGDTQANRVYLAAIAEKNAISGLHTQTIKSQGQELTINIQERSKEPKYPKLNTA